MQYLKEQWMHGTEVYFDKWVLPIPKPQHKGGLEAHSALFFTTSKEFALGSGEGTGGLVVTSIKPYAKVLDMENCTPEESETFRLKALTKNTASKNIQVVNKAYWQEGWKSGSIMKYAPSSNVEHIYFEKKKQLALKHKGTPEGSAAYNEIQLLTRNNIEDLVCAANDLGYDCVIGNEIDTLHKDGVKTYRIMFVNNIDIITEPKWLSKPKPLKIKSTDTIKKHSLKNSKNKNRKNNKS